MDLQKILKRAAAIGAMQGQALRNEVAVTPTVAGTATAGVAAPAGAAGVKVGGPAIVPSKQANDDRYTLSEAVDVLMKAAKVIETVGAKKTACSAITTTADGTQIRQLADGLWVSMPPKESDK